MRLETKVSGRLAWMTFTENLFNENGIRREVMGLRRRIGLMRLMGETLSRGAVVYSYLSGRFLKI